MKNKKHIAQHFLTQNSLRQLRSPGDWQFFHVAQRRRSDCWSQWFCALHELHLAQQFLLSTNCKWRRFGRWNPTDISCPVFWSWPRPLGHRARLSISRPFGFSSSWCTSDTLREAGQRGKPRWWLLSDRQCSIDRIALQLPKERGSLSRLLAASSPSQIPRSQPREFRPSPLVPRPKMQLILKIDAKGRSELKHEKILLLWERIAITSLKVDSRNSVSDL